MASRRVELARIRDAYERRDHRLGRDDSSLVRFQDLARKESVFRLQRIDRGVIRVLAREFDDLSEVSVLDVGCGLGHFLRLLGQYGAQPGHCAGVDLLANRLI